MPLHYHALKSQIIEDVRTALENAEAEVVFGSPRREITSYPHAVVRSECFREFDTARSVRESYTFTIELRLEVPVPYPDEGHETLLMERADALILILAPHSATAVPTPAGAYAGVGYSRRVLSVVPIPTDDSDGYVAVQVAFAVDTTVYQ